MVANKDFEMPNTCGDCPYCIHTADEKRYIGYCNTSDDDYYCKALDRFMEYDEVDGGVDILGKPSDCPLVEAIPKDQYETRLKADMIAKLTDIQLEIGESTVENEEYRNSHVQSGIRLGKHLSKAIIQDKINSLKENKNE